MTFPPEFYGMATGLWTVYWPVILIWLALLVGLAVLAAVVLLGFYILRPVFGG